MVQVITDMYGTVPFSVRAAATKTEHYLGYSAKIHIKGFQAPTNARITGGRGLLDLVIEGDTPELKGLEPFYANVLRSYLTGDGFQASIQY